MHRQPLAATHLDDAAHLHLAPPAASHLLTIPALHPNPNDPHLQVVGGHAAQQVDSGSLGAAHLRQAHLPRGDLPGVRRRAEVAAEGNCSNSSLDCLGTAECAEVEPAPTRQQRVRGNGHLLGGATLLRQLCAKSNPCLLLALLQRLLIEVSAQGEQCHQLGIRRKADSLSVSRI